MASAVLLITTLLNVAVKFIPVKKLLKVQFCIVIPNLPFAVIPLPTLLPFIECPWQSKTMLSAPIIGPLFEPQFTFPGKLKLDMIFWLQIGGGADTKLPKLIMTEDIRRTNKIKILFIKTPNTYMKRENKYSSLVSEI